MCNLPEITLYPPKGWEKNNVVKTLRKKNSIPKHKKPGFQYSHHQRGWRVGQFRQTCSVVLRAGFRSGGGRPKWEEHELFKTSSLRHFQKVLSKKQIKAQHGWEGSLDYDQIFDICGCLKSNSTVIRNLWNGEPPQNQFKSEVS